MIHSMTGFAVQSRDLGPVTLHLELRSVNSRYLDLSFRICEELRQIEPRLRELIGAKLNRGKVECRLNLQTNTAAPRDLSLNTALLGQLERAQASLHERLPEPRRCPSRSCCAGRACSPMTASDSMRCSRRCLKLPARRSTR